MRQVPKNLKYLIIGSGRVSKHFAHYFSLLEIQTSSWNRKESLEKLKKISLDVTHVLVLISDNALSDFISQHSFLKTKKIIHFSGATTIKDVSSAHPLMTFNTSLYDLETYKSIPFICDDKFDFNENFPMLPNPNYKIKMSDQSFYHSLIAMAGNFPQILWSSIENQLETRLELPSDILNTYLNQVVKNQINDSKNALTGPFERGDKKTIAKHLDALENNNLKDIYKSFLKFYQETNK